MEYMRTLPDKAFALALADPPYGMDASSSQGAGKLKSRVLNQGNIKRWDKAPTAEFFSELRRVCENVIIMKDGGIVEQGRTQDVFSHPKHEYSQRLLDETRRIQR
jgi:ABC-type phosphonate transport system ATPase subunit